MIRALIFDYFGVIRLTGLRSAYVRLGGDLSKDEAFVTDVTTAANYGFIDDADQQLADRLGIDVDQWRKAVLRMPANDPELLGYIEDLHASKRFKIGLLSNAGKDALTDYFAPGEPAKYFDVTLFSGEVGLAKPQAAFYRLMAERLGVEPQECVMIDDRDEFCKGAAYVGMQTIRYKDFASFKRELALLASQS